MSQFVGVRLLLILLVPGVSRIRADESDPLAGLPRPIVRTEDRALEPMQGRVIRFRSGVYGDLQPVAICVTELSDRPKPLIVDLIPGTLSRLERAAMDCERICRIARAKGKACVAIRPCGRGNGSVFQGYGETDAFEAIAAVRELVAIDADRISLTGASMGGAGTWYLASHYPDAFAAAAPFCGYCDYALWDKPGGTTFHRQPWEVFSWVSRGAAYRAGNLRHVALRITHGEWDRAVGGGVPVEHSRQMNRKLSGLGVPPIYVEVPKTGHGCRTPEQWDATIAWLLDQKRVADADRISLVVHTLRHNRIRWVAVVQQGTYGKPSTVDARRGRQIVIDTDNVRRLAIGPVPDVTRIVRHDAAKSPLPHGRGSEPSVAESTADPKRVFAGRGFESGAVS